MKRTHLLAAAYLLDQLAGDPEWFPHPVRIMGMAIHRGERALRKPDDGPARELVAGALLTGGLVAATYLVTRTTIRLAHKRSNALGSATEVLLAWTCLAARNLQQEAQTVSAALDLSNLPLARTRLARIVGRDTHSLNAQEISRALIETLAESASDGVVAPIVYLAVGGVPLAMAYKAVNTLDSMIGHRDQRYLYFGRAAARLDDAANYAPARITALSIIAISIVSRQADPCTAWNTWRRDGGKHKSPNAGQPEAAISGALQVRLGGDNRYDGELIPAPLIGEQFLPPTPAKARQAIRLTAAVSLLGLAVGVILAASHKQRKSKPCR